MNGETSTSQRPTFNILHKHGRRLSAFRRTIEEMTVVITLKRRKGRWAYTIVACLRFSVETHCPPCGNTVSYWHVHTHAYLSINRVQYIAHVNVMYWCIMHSTPYDISEVVARPRLSVHFYAAMRKNAHINFNWSLVRQNTDQLT